MTEVKKSAGRPKAVKVEDENKITTTDGVVEDEPVKLKEENSAMAEMLKQMQAQMAQLQAQLNNPMQPQVFVTQEANKDMTRTVTVIGTLPFTQVLTTEPFGRGGRVYVLEGLYESKPIPFTDMQRIVVNAEQMINDGRIILKSQKDYEDLQIGHVYDNVLSLESIKELIELKSKDAVDTILELSKEMQEGILTSIATNIINKKDYDYNIIKLLKNEGIDIDEIVDTLEEDLDEEA